MCFCIPLLLISCNKDSEVIQLNGNYLGILTFEYSRYFPPFDKTVNIDLELKKNGQLVFSEPDIYKYEASDELNHTIKVREKGQIFVNSLSGKIIFDGSQKYVLINSQTQVNGHINTWGWDDEIGWVFSQANPVVVSDPIQNSLKFDFIQSTLAGDEIGETITGVNGEMNFKWSLLLFPKLEN